MLRDQDRRGPASFARNPANFRTALATVGTYFESGFVWSGCRNGL